MGTRSAVLGYGTTSGTTPVEIFTCPANRTAIAKFVTAGFDPGVIDVQGNGFLFYQPSGGGVIPIALVAAFASFQGPGAWAASEENNIWQVLGPGDGLLIASDGLYDVTMVVSGAILLGIES